jgi:hypothetical protein
LTVPGSHAPRKNTSTYVQPEKGDDVGEKTILFFTMHGQELLGTVPQKNAKGITLRILANMQRCQGRTLNPDM